MSSKLIRKNTITREYLSKAIKKNTGIGANKAAKVVDDLIDVLIASIKEGKEVKLRLFGSFTTKKKNERVGRNPKTMEEAVIPSRKVVKFKVAPTMKKRINSNIQNMSGVC
jgi:integration host factor subunit alpha